MDEPEGAKRLTKLDLLSWLALLLYVVFVDLNRNCSMIAMNGAFALFLVTIILTVIIQWRGP